MKLSSREYKILTDEIKKVEKAESRLLFRRKKRKDESPGFIRKKIPEKTYLTLESAFEKAFRLIFNKGGGIIEKTSQLEKIRLQSEEFEESMHRMIHEGTIKAIDNLATSSAQNSKLMIICSARVSMPSAPTLAAAAITSILYEFIIFSGIAEGPEQGLGSFPARKW